MINTQNHYDILGVSKTSSEQEIKKAYRTLSLKHHPDRGGDKLLFQQINEAYEVLSDPVQKEQYDNPSHSIDNINIQEEMNNIFDIFRNLSKHRFEEPSTFQNSNIFFHNMTSHSDNNGMPFFVQHSFHSKPIPIIYNINISFEQSYKGVTIPIEHEKWVIKDNNKIFEKYTLYVEIQPGIEDNEEIILSQKGNEINNTLIGDVKVIVHVDMASNYLENKNIFERNGLNLIIHKTITLKESLCGFSFELCHPIGKKLLINNTNLPQITAPLSTRTIPNYGMVRGNTKGNLIIKFNVEFPKSLSIETQQILSEILK